MMIRWRDNSIRLIAFFMAVLLWVYVTNEQNPVSSHTYQVPLTVQGKPEGYVLSGLPGKVSIKAKIPRNLSATLRLSDFTAQVNLRGITEGEQQLPVQVTAPPGVEVIQVTPKVVRVAADKITQKNVPVTLNLKGEVARGLVQGKPVLQPQTITLEGPGKLLAGINHVGVAVDLSGVENDLVKEVTVQTGVKGVTASPSRVLVTVPVTSLPVKELPVRVELTGAPAEGYLVGEVAVLPATVQVTGPKQVIEALTEVNAQAVDISGVTKDVSREVGLVPPNGVISLQPKQVHIAVEIIPEVIEPQPDPEEEPEQENPENITGQ
ncbi:YbbR-like protein [Sporotomaculum syntrophicum]|uniref:YbbR-like protein n=1 Tax=Sporotomaculum syntrophicum TaxID=182264 RepID=A0A9D2WQ66_9FIRM|nr:CdaR family protein [Sporotomaculum syntrophicum]KAF1085068.1 YbbR-like protein [Sporotomaculum syntrophicum]